MLDPELALAALGFVILFGSSGSRAPATGPPVRQHSRAFRRSAPRNVQAKLDPTGPTSSIASAAAGKIVVSCAE
jgi:hypothetical protein